MKRSQTRGLRHSRAGFGWFPPRSFSRRRARLAFDADPSLGAVAYHLLSGQPPFTGTVDEVLKAHEMLPPTSLGILRTGISPSLENAIHRALAKNPVNRQPSIREFFLETQMGFRDMGVDVPDYEATRS